MFWVSHSSLVSEPKAVGICPSQSVYFLWVPIAHEALTSVLLLLALFPIFWILYFSDHVHLQFIVGRYNYLIASCDGNMDMC